MKKSKILALVLAISVMLLGAGYAIWTDAINVKGTVSTGKLDVKVVESSVYLFDGDNLGEKQRAWTEAELGPVDADEGIEITVNKLYPGADVRLDFTIKNEGDIPVKLKEVKVNRTEGNPALFSKLTASGSVIYDNDGDGVKDSNHIAFGYKHPNKDFLTNLEANLMNILGDVVIYPGGTISFDPSDDGCIRFGLNKDVTNEFMELTCKFNIKFIFEQDNTPAPTPGV